jgi:hypothetical protein
MNLVGGLYPGLYDWLVEVPVEPPTEFPPGTCVTSDIQVRCDVTAEIENRVLVEACIQVHQVPVPKPEVPVLVMACEIDSRQKVTCETLEHRSLVESECVGVSYQEYDVEPEPSGVCLDGVEVRCLAISAIDCKDVNVGVKADVYVRVKVTADLSCCCK